MKDIELLKTKLEFYRQQTDKVRQLVFDSKEIGEPCQPLYDAICDKLNEQSNQLAEKEKEIEVVAQQLQGAIKDYNYCKARCEAAEKVIGFTDIPLSCDQDQKIIYDNWEKLKNANP